MDKIILEQLQKCKIANIPAFDDNSTCIYIPKSEGAQRRSDIEVGMCYRIRVEDYIVKPYEGFTLHDNWNNGVVPTDVMMNCEVQQIMGSMVKVTAVGLNDSKPWVGWLPRKSFRVLEEI